MGSSRHAPTLCPPGLFHAVPLPFPSPNSTGYNQIHPSRLKCHFLHKARPDFLVRIHHSFRGLREGVASRLREGVQKGTVVKCTDSGFPCDWADILFLLFAP